jgi:acetyl-CoA C-acetyltransferase
VVATAELIKIAVLCGLQNAVLSLAIAQELGLPEDIVTVDDHSIPRGCPMASTGVVVLTRVTHSLRREGLQRGKVTLFTGGGDGAALAIEALGWLAR